jgi:hypothetical protein
MKKYYYFLAVALIASLAALVTSCKKNKSAPPTDIGTRTSFTEEFEDVSQLEAKGWVFKDLSSAQADWGQGQFGYDKGGKWRGFEAFSYTIDNTEYAYCFLSTDNSNTSSWMITPVLSVKNGDKISFYTRGDTTTAFYTRMQVLMNKLASANVGNKLVSTGDFKITLFDINPNQALGGYPTIWKKYEYTFSDINGKADTRIAFRHFVGNNAYAGGVGIDQFRFEVK